MDRIETKRNRRTNFRFGLGLLAGLAAGALSPAIAATLPKATVLPVELAQKAVQAAMAQCLKDGYRVGVAVVDRHGIVRASALAEGGPAHLPESAKRKAYTAGAFGRPTSAVVTMIANTPALQNMQNMGGDILILGGGLPIQFDGEIVGGIGVGGAPGAPLDEACAQAGLTTIGATPIAPASQ